MRPYTCCFISFNNEKLNKNKVLCLEKLLNKLIVENNVKKYLFFNLNNFESNAYKIIGKYNNCKKIICKNKIVLSNKKVYYKNIEFDEYKNNIINNKNLIDASNFCLFLDFDTSLINLYNSIYFELLTYAKSKNKVLLFI